MLKASCGRRSKAVVNQQMTPEDAIRYLDHQAKECRGRDASEALCLLLPALLRILELERMEDAEALAFQYGFKRDLAALVDGRPGPVSGQRGYQSKRPISQMRPLSA
jgi:hypothetical protein